MRKNIVLLLIMIILLPLYGCIHGPDSNVLKDEIQKKLDNRFEKSLFEVVSMKRNGSYFFNDKSGKTNLLVYFKAKIKFKKDYNLSEWDKLNANTLSTVLGATKHGISGINIKGNKKGDILKVFGTSTYVSKNGKWVLSNSTVPKNIKNKKGPVYDEKTPLDNILSELNKKNNLFKKKNKKKAAKIVEDELKPVMKRINLKLDRLNSIITFLSGTKKGEYYALGKGIEEAFKFVKIPFRNYSTTGSIENCKLVDDGLADFGISQNDTAFMASNGYHLFKGAYPLKNIRAVCSLYPEAIQIVTLKSLNINKMSDLKGKRIDIGEVGSGTRINALQILKYNGFSDKDFAKISETSVEKAVALLKSGKIDLFFCTWAYPGNIIENLASEVPIKLISIDKNISDEIRKNLPYLIPITIPKNTYLGMEEDVNTLAVTAMIIVNKDVSDKVVKNFLKTIFENQSILQKESIQANYLSKKTSLIGISIDLHNGAKEYFEKTK